MSSAGPTEWQRHHLLHALAQHAVDLLAPGLLPAAWLCHWCLHCGLTLSARPPQHRDCCHSPSCTHSSQASTLNRRDHVKIMLRLMLAQTTLVCHQLAIKERLQDAGLHIFWQEVARHVFKAIQLAMKLENFHYLDHAGVARDSSPKLRSCELHCSKRDSMYCRFGRYQPDLDEP